MMSAKLIDTRINALVSMLQSGTWTDQQLAAHIGVSRSRMMFIAQKARERGHNIRRVMTGMTREGVYEILPGQYKLKAREKLYYPHTAVDTNNQ